MASHAASRTAMRVADREIKTLWIGAEKLGAFGGLIQLAMLTAMRRSELSGLKW